MSSPANNHDLTATLTEAAGLAPGAVLSGYEVEHEIGRGATGTVYRVRHLVLGHPVAIKVLRPELTVNRRAVKRFRREARIAANLASEFFVRVHDLVEEERLTYLVMDYVDGEPLGRRVRRSGALEFRTACRYVRDVALGLSEIHRKDIVHRDIKPDNILVQRAGHIKITDLGLATDLFQEEELTQRGVVLGTPRYIAPEQARGDPADARSDIYSLGMTLYFLVFGLPPYAETDSVAQLLTKHLYEPLSFPGQTPPDVRGGIVPLIKRMTAKEPGERIQTADEVATALDEILAESRGTEVLPAVRIRQEVRRGGRRLFAVLAALACAVTALAFVLSRMAGEAFWSSKMIPADCVLFVADNDLGALWDEVDRQYGAYKPYPEAYAQLKEQMEDLQDETEECLGTRITSKYSLEEVGVWLGGGCGAALLSVAGDGVVVVGVSDREAFSRAASRWLWGQEAPGAVVDVSGVEVHVGSEFGSEPCFLFVGRKAVVCANARSARAVISAVEHPNLALASSPEFRSATSRLPAGSRNVLYVNKNLLMADIIAAEREAAVYAPWLLALSQLVGSVRFAPSSVAANLIWDWNSPAALAEVLEPEPDFFHLLGFAPADSVFAFAVSTKTPSELYRAIHRYLEERSPQLKVRLDNVVDDAVEETEMARPEELLKALGNQVVLVLTDLADSPGRRLFGACAVRDPRVLEDELEKLFQYLSVEGGSLHRPLRTPPPSEEGEGFRVSAHSFQDLASSDTDTGGDSPPYDSEERAGGQTGSEEPSREEVRQQLQQRLSAAVALFEEGRFREARVAFEALEPMAEERGVRLGERTLRRIAEYRQRIDAELLAEKEAAEPGTPEPSPSPEQQAPSTGRGSTLAAGQRDVVGRSVTCWFFEDERGERQELLCYCFTDEALVVTGTVALMEEVLERKATGGESLLGRSAVRLAAEGRPSALFYLNLTQGLATALRSSDEEVRDAAERSGYSVYPFSELCVVFRAEPEALFWDVRLQSKPR